MRLKYSSKNFAKNFYNKTFSRSGETVKKFKELVAFVSRTKNNLTVSNIKVAI